MGRRGVGGPVLYRNNASHIMIYSTDLKLLSISCTSLRLGESVRAG